MDWWEHWKRWHLRFEPMACGQEPYVMSLLQASCRVSSSSGAPPAPRTLSWLKISRSVFQSGMFIELLDSHGSDIHTCKPLFAVQPATLTHSAPPYSLHFQSRSFVFGSRSTSKFLLKNIGSCRSLWANTIASLITCSIRGHKQGQE